MDILLIVACRQALNLFEATEKSFDGVTLGLIGPVVELWVVPTPGRNNSLYAAGSQCYKQRRKITIAGSKKAGWGQAAEQRQGPLSSALEYGRQLGASHCLIGEVRRGQTALSSKNSGPRLTNYS
jgi:hypothetical protein